MVGETISSQNEVKQLCAEGVFCGPLDTWNEHGMVPQSSHRVGGFGAEVFVLLLQLDRPW